MGFRKSSPVSAQECPIAAETIIKNGLCSGCGACVAVCPQAAITIDHPSSYKPVIDREKCVRCNKCVRVCPGKGWPAEQWAAELCRREALVMNRRFGPARGFFLGRAVDPQVRVQGASGGVATGLPLYLLASNKVDVVAVVGLENGFPVAKITDDPQIVRSCGASKYSPVPVMEHILKKLSLKPCRIAMTALPCHMAALQAAIKEDKTIAGNEIFAIGLFCGDIKDYQSVYRIAETLSLAYPGQALFRGWRCGLWPGTARFELKDGSFRERPLQSWLNVSIPYYALERCLMCPSRENWLADVALADNHVGATSETVIVARTRKGYDLLLGAAEKGFIALTPVLEKEAYKIVTQTKFLPALAYIQRRKKEGLTVPLYDHDEQGILRQYGRRKRALYALKYSAFMWMRKERIINFLIARPGLMERVGGLLNNLQHLPPGRRAVSGLLKRVRGAIALGGNTTPEGHHFS